MLSLTDVTIDYQGKEIVTNFSLNLPIGEIHALMGPNGSGKSTLSLALAGHPQYHLSTWSKIVLDKTDLMPLLPEKRAQAGLFLSFQTPVSIPGITVKQVMKTMIDHLHTQKKSIPQFLVDLKHYSDLVGIKHEYLDRSLNDGFSGGEKKRIEMLALLLAQPKVAILDEIDSGLDIDSIKMIAKSVKLAQQQFKTAFLTVTHYRRILDYLKPDMVHVLIKGKLIKSGTQSLIDQIETNGYQELTQKSHE